MRVSVEGVKELQQALGNMSDDIAAKVGEVVMETAANVEAGVKLRIAQGPATGAVYYRIDNGNGTYSLFAGDSEGYVGTFSGAGLKATHQSSAPGEAPASDTGTLLGSIYHEKTAPLSAVVGSRLEYAAYLEFGTFTMHPRPAWTPEVEQTRPEFVNDIRDALSRAIT